MKRKIFALLEVDDDTAFQKIDDGPVPYLDKEMERLEQSQIFLKDAFIADEDEDDTEQAYLNYLAVWVFDHLYDEMYEDEPACFREWKRQNTFV
ncbi:MAG: hypothetical protein HFE65_00040 [Clostridiales bacterium]|nr:hypothetical protein [Clostridiales bacterium]